MSKLRLIAGLFLFTLKNITVKNLLFILALCLSFTSVGNTPPELSNTNFLILEGVILNKEKATIMVFQYDTTGCQWVRLENHINKKRFELYLDPTKSYQIWFQQESGYNKILYVDPGDGGQWVANMNIDFSKINQCFAHLYQVCNEDDTSYLVEFIYKSQTDHIPANNCDNCIGTLANNP